MRWCRIIISCLSLYVTLPLAASGLQSDIDHAARIIEEFRGLSESSVPAGVLQNAQGFAILRVFKAGLVVSLKGGKGVVVGRTPDGWSAPSGIALAGAGLGFQIGAQATDLILVLNTESAVRAFSHGGNLTLGGDVTVAAGPMGRTLGAAIMPMAAVYTYSRSRGVFVGLSLEGAVITERKRANRAFYGIPVTAKELLFGTVPSAVTAQALYTALGECGVSHIAEVRWPVEGHYTY